MDILEKIRKFRTDRNWTEYQLAEKSELPQSTISSWYRKKQLPTISSLEKICKAFNITLSQFFTEDNSEQITLTEKQSKLLKEWNRLSDQQQNAFLTLLETL